MNKRKEGELDLKIVLLGKNYAGKTCLAQRYVNQMYTEIGRMQKSEVFQTQITLVNQTHTESDVDRNRKYCRYQ